MDGALVFVRLVMLFTLLISSIGCGSGLRIEANETSKHRAERQNLPFRIDSQRIAIAPPQGKVPLGNPFDLTLTLAPGTVEGEIEIIQANEHGILSQGSGPAKVVARKGRTITVEIVPAQINTISVEVDAVYSDNVLARQMIHLNVVPSSKGIKQFALFGGGIMALEIYGKDPENQVWLRPTATYATLPLPIHLEDVSQIGLTVLQDEVNPVIKVDKRGLVHALRPGTATIIGDFDGIRDSVRVIVESHKG